MLLVFFAVGFHQIYVWRCSSSKQYPLTCTSVVNLSRTKLRHRLYPAKYPKETNAQLDNEVLAAVECVKCSCSTCLEQAAGSNKLCELKMAGLVQHNEFQVNKTNRTNH